MAKNQFKTADEINLNDDLDVHFDDFDFGTGAQSKKDDRSPVIKAMGAIKKGGKDYLSNQSNVEKFLKAALPKGFGEAYDLGQEAKSELSELYNSVGGELAPATNQAKALARKMLPKLDKHLPKALKKKLEELTADTSSSSYQRSDKARQEDQLGSLLGEIFSEQFKGRQAQREETDTRERIKQGFDQLRHRDQLSQLNAIRLATQSQADYNTRITSQVQRKTLEIAYRQYWLLADLMQEQKTSNKEMLRQMQATVKNTGLPDFVKTRAHERFKEITRNKFLESARDSFFGGNKDYLRKFSKNLRGQLMQAASGAAAAGQMATTMGDMQLQQNEMGMGDNRSLMEMLLSRGTEWASDYASEKASKVLYDKLAKNRKMRKMGGKLSYGVSTAGERLHGALTDPTRSWGVLEGLRELLANSAPSLLADSKVEMDNAGLGTQPKPFSRSNSKSLDEVIPGLLARIHREVRILRTGDEATPLIAYDYTKNRFTTEKAAGDSIKAAFMGKNAETVMARADKLLDQVDKGGKLTPALREKARKELISKALKGGSMDASKLHQASHWGGGEDGAAIASVFSRHLRVDQDGQLGDYEGSVKRQIALAKDFQGLTSGLQDPRAVVQTLVNMGQSEMLRRAGILDETNNVSRDAIAKLLSGEVIPHAMVEEAIGVVKRSDRRTDPGVARRMMSQARQQHAEQMQTLDGLRAMQQAAAADSVNTTTGAPVNMSAPRSETLLPVLQSQDATLLRIEEILKSGTGLQLHALDRLHRGQQGDFSEDGEVSEGGGAKRRSFSSLWEHARVSGKETFDKARKGTSDFLKRYGPGALQRGRNAVDLARSKIFDFAGKTRNKLEAFYGDVYVGSSGFPRLRKALMEAGEYRDKKTGEVIKSLKDIKGDVIDSAGNVVMTLEEMKDAYVGGNYRKMLLDVLRSAGSILGMGSNALKELIPMGVQKAIHMGRSLLKRAKELLPPFDVYVSGDMNTPVLYAQLMRAGKYFSKKTSKAIKHPRDIDGEVIDSDGNVVVSEDQLKKGLVDVGGISISSPALRALAKIGGVAAKAWGAFKSAGRAALSFLGGAADGVAKFFQDMFVPFREIHVNSKRSVELLTDIRDILDTRMPGKGRVRGDSDGDGVRDGSLEDIRRKRKQAQEEKQNKAAKTTETKDSKGGGMMAKLAALFSGLGKKKGEDSGAEKEGDTNIGITTGDGGKGGKTTKVPKKPGRFGRLGRIGAAIGRGALGAGRLGLGLLGLGLPGAAGAITTAASMGASAIGATAGAVGSAATWLGGAAVGAAPAILTALSSIMLPAMAIGAVGYLGYKAYKWSQETKVTALSEIRLAQYGFKAENKEWANKVFALEQEACANAIQDPSGAWMPDNQKVDLKGIAESFEVKSSRSLEMFNQWYKARFLPVFGKHMTKLKSLDAKAKSFKDIEELVQPKDKKAYVQATIDGLETAHSMMMGPSQAYPKLDVDQSALLELIRTKSAILDKQAESQTGVKAAAVIAQQAALTTQSPEEQAKKAIEDAAKYQAKDKDGNILQGITQQDLTERIKQGTATVSVAVAVPEQLLHTDPGRLDALTSIRYKAYGLKEMSIDKVRMLGALEMFLETKIVGGPDKATLSIKTDEVAQIAGSVFGLNSSTGRQAERWKTWFNGRFLPVFMLYASSLKKISGKDNLKQALMGLPVGRQVEIARALIGAMGINENGARVPVWSIGTNPWRDDYELNSDADSTASNLEAIRVLADKAVLGETTAKIPANREMDPTKPAFGWYNTGAARAGASRGNGGGASTAGKGLSATGDNLTDGKALSGAGDKITTTGGSGGNYAEMKVPTGTGWSALKDTVFESARMTGVDPMLLARIMAVESDFNPDAVPRKKDGSLASSAKGLAQFLDGTWAEMMSKHGAKFGIPQGTQATDPRAASLMLGMYLKENADTLRKQLGRDVTSTDVYMAHFMGAGGATSFLKAGPNAIGSEVAPAAAKSNRGVFFDASGKPLTVAQVYDQFQQKLEKKAAANGVKAADFAGIKPAGNSSSTATSSAPAAPAPIPQGPQSGQAGAQAATAPTVPVSPTARPGVGSPSFSGPVTRDDSKNAVIGKGMNMDAGYSFELVLEREDSTDDGTYGVLRFPDGTSLNTLELPWLDNRPRVSCIPAGSYKCKKRASKSFGMAYEVQGVPGRSAVLIHAGNAAGNAEKGMKADSQGCILLGMGRATRGNQKIITSSRDAMKLFEEKTAGRDFTLNVRPSKNVGAQKTDLSKPETSTTTGFDALKNSGVQPPVPVAMPPSVAPESNSVRSTPPPDNRMAAASAALSQSYSPSTTEKAQQDDLSKQLIPRVDVTNTTLAQSLDVHKQSLGVLQQILSQMAVKEAPNSPTSPASSSAGKMRPVLTSDVSVPQRIGSR